MTKIFGKLLHWLTDKPAETAPAKGREEAALDAAIELCHKYAQILEFRDGLVRSESDLPCDKDTLKAALYLLHIRNKDESYRESIRSCFISLAHFQKLERSEKDALLAHKKVLDLHKSGSSNHDELLSSILASGATIPLMSKVSVEMAQLQVELVSRGMVGTGT